jgi:Flp pilus assembly protein TadB
MSDNLEKALAELITKAKDSIDASTGFMSAELPVVIEQALVWHFVYSLILFGVGICLMSLSVKLARQAKAVGEQNRARAKQEYEAGEAWTRYRPGSTMTSARYDWVTETGDYASVARWILSPICFIVSLTLLNLQWLKIWIAPKLWLIEHAAQLAK